VHVHDPRVVAARVVAITCAALMLLAGCGDDSRTADWWVDPSAELQPATREIPIIVNENACASGRSAEGRIQVDVDYGSDAVHFDVKVRSLGRDQDCPGNPDTPYVVVLDEPLGVRPITGQPRSTY
jgi:hypothetical protein